MKEVIIDGANVATVNNPKRRRSSRIESAIGHLDLLADRVRTVLPSYWVWSGIPIEDPEIIERLVQEDKLDFIQKNDDDYYIIKYCVKFNAFLLSNDKLKNYRNKEWWTHRHEEWTKTHLLEFEFINDTLLLSEKATKKLTPTIIEPPSLGLEIIAETG